MGLASVTNAVVMGVDVDAIARFYPQHYFSIFIS